MNLYTTLFGGLSHFSTRNQSRMNERKNDTKRINQGRTYLPVYIRYISALESTLQTTKKNQRLRNEERSIKGNERTKLMHSFIKRVHRTSSRNPTLTAVKICRAQQRQRERKRAKQRENVKNRGKPGQNIKTDY